MSITDIHPHPSLRYGSVVTSPTNGGALLSALDAMITQIEAAGGNPDMINAGSDFIDAYQRELRANGHAPPLQAGFHEYKFRGCGIYYDPTLDNLGLSTRAYILHRTSSAVIDVV